jgi:hypothetical protein
MLVFFHNDLKSSKEDFMKRILIAVALVMLLVAVALQSQTPAPKPGPEQKKLEIWVGDWTYEGETRATPLGPAGKFIGKNSTRPILGGFFIEFRGEEKGPSGALQWYEIDGYDPVSKRFSWNNFASEGSVQAITYTIEGTTVSFSGTQVTGGKQYKIRGTFAFAPDFTSSVGKFEMSVDGTAWMPISESRATKIKSSPK